MYNTHSLLHYYIYNTAAIYYLGLVIGKKKSTLGFFHGNCTSLRRFYLMEDQNSMKLYTKI